MTARNIDLVKICPELELLTREARAVHVHFKKKETLRDWPAIEKRVFQTKLTVTIEEAFAIEKTMLKLARENNKLRETVEFLNNLPEKQCPRCNPSE